MSLQDAIGRAIIDTLRTEAPEDLKAHLRDVHQLDLDDPSLDLANVEDYLRTGRCESEPPPPTSPRPAGALHLGIELLIGPTVAAEFQRLGEMESLRALQQALDRVVFPSIDVMDALLSDWAARLDLVPQAQG